MQDQPGTPRPPRVMFYSHDTFGLGHLRRSRALAAALTEGTEGASAIILTGSPVAGRFTFPERVDHIRLPGVTKLPDGSYISSTLGLDIEETTRLRAGLIQSAVEQYQPNLLIVDKEPAGFRGELLHTLEWLQENSQCRVVLGLRDVLDDPATLAVEWERKGAVRAAEAFYDEFWVYGLENVYDPTEGLAFSAQTRARIHYTGYLRRATVTADDVPETPYILITPGGGGDGAAMVSQVLSAYEADPDLKPDALLVYGPFLSGEVREALDVRVAALNGRVTATGFESRIEALYAGAQGVVCMGGYNTFCEVLSFDKRAVIVPRTSPRLEQYIRASRAQELGLVRMLAPGEVGDETAAMIAAIRGLPNQRRPSEAGADGLLDGLDVVRARAAALLSKDTA
ncbi:hypothetical protein KDD17_01005 [Sulfitobacter albidus]|uniref:Glycosyl transferase family 28 C-terminal domain-containing protein n=1 Tax=Sulfitobacter albidus TaxID=2829501 RepID=A0A975JDY6_9RHOB|nr:glycosyltransferase [Sulfitobacter albidus]QUJ76678.1 hypothetical protein KDD17_01005 [Sulfitobacter albidus]